MTARNYFERNFWIGDSSERLVSVVLDGAYWLETDTEKLWAFWWGWWHDLGSGGGGGLLGDHDHSGDPGDGGAFDAANLTSGAASAGDVLTADGGGSADWQPSTGGIPDASDVTYTPADVSDWTGGVDPGNADDAFDQLAQREHDHELLTTSAHGGVLPSTAFDGLAKITVSAIAPVAPGLNDLWVDIS